MSAKQFRASETLLNATDAQLRQFALKQAATVGCSFEEALAVLKAVIAASQPKAANDS
jgi:hypothetical protein